MWPYGCLLQYSGEYISVHADVLVSSSTSSRTLYHPPPTSTTTSITINNTANFDDYNVHNNNTMNSVSALSNSGFGLSALAIASGVSFNPSVGLAVPTPTAIIPSKLDLDIDMVDVDDLMEVDPEPEVDSDIDDLCAAMQDLSLGGPTVTMDKIMDVDVGPRYLWSVLQRAKILSPPPTPTATATTLSSALASALRWAHNVVPPFTPPSTPPRGQVKAEKTRSRRRALLDPIGRAARQAQRKLDKALFMFR